MKKILLLIALLGIVSNTFSQVEGRIRNIKPSFVTQFSFPYKEMKVDIEEDIKGYFSKMEVEDSTLVFRNSSEYNSYISKLKKSQKKSKSTPPDITPYMVTNRKLLRPGLEIELHFDEYRISARNIAKYIVIKTKIEGSDSFEGVFEGIKNDLAVIDGKSAKLKEKAIIEGIKGLEGLKYDSFEKMMIGSFVRVEGVRQPDGVLLVEKGKAWENAETPEDAKLKLSLRNTLKITSTEVAFGSIKFKLLKNSELIAYISEVGRSVIPQYQKELPKGHPVKIDFNFYVVEDSTFNACAYPDGSIFVHTALLAQLENEAQLASVLGHEIAHTTYEHARLQAHKQRAIDGLSTFATFLAAAKVLPADLVMLTVAFGGPALSSKYSRNFEEQADRAGLTYMYQAGYDPREAGKIWKKLSELTDPSALNFGANLVRATEKGINSMYASHPDAISRYKNLNRLIASNFYEEDLSTLKINTKEYRAQIKALRKWLQGTTNYEPDPIIVPKSAPAAGVTNKPANKIKTGNKRANLTKKN